MVVVDKIDAGDWMGLSTMVVREGLSSSVGHARDGGDH